MSPRMATWQARRPTPPRLDRRVDVLVDGVERQLQPVGNAQLVEDVVKVVLHRLLADEHLLGHFLILESLRDQHHDLTLALAERRTVTIATTQRRALHRRR